QSTHDTRYLPSFPTRRSSDLLLPSLFQMLDEIAERCREVGHVRVLCDFRNVRGTLAEMTRYLIGVRVAEVLKTIKLAAVVAPDADRKSTRLNSSHVKISYAVF